LDVNAKLINGVQGAAAGGAPPAGNNVVSVQGIASMTPVQVTVIGRTTWVSVTPTITATTYTALLPEIGGLMTFAIGGSGSGVLESIRVTSKTKQTTALSLFLFDTNPTNSTWTDHALPAINAADVGFVMGSFNLGAPTNALGTHALWNLSGIGFSFVGANLYGILMNTSGSTTVTFGSTTDVTVKIGIIDD
jgi:hypothetical protein